MTTFKAKDYNDYNKKLGLFGYGYLHRLLDILYKLKIQYGVTDESLVYWESETGNQAELKESMLLNINKRIYLHKKIFKRLWKQRHAKPIIRPAKFIQLSLW